MVLSVELGKSPGRGWPDKDINLHFKRLSDSESYKQKPPPELKARWVQEEVSTGGLDLEPSAWTQQRKLQKPMESSEDTRLEDQIVGLIFFS